MFVIVGSWKNLTLIESKLPLVQRMALTLKRAGVSVTVTSITDIVAFAIGASTVKTKESKCPFFLLQYDQKKGHLFNFYYGNLLL
jgi:hypothetical protein